jgi:hypothetical protein
MRLLPVLAVLLAGALARAESADSWIPSWRLAIAVDAAQTFSLRHGCPGLCEKNALYRRMGDWEASSALIAAGWLAERAVTGIRDERTRAIVGWLMTAAELWVVADNGFKGVPLFSLKL